MLHQLNRLPVAKRIQFKLLVLVYKASHSLTPQYLAELVQPYIPARTRSSNDNLIVVPKYKLSMVGGRAFCIIGPKLWNKLPPLSRRLSLNLKLIYSLSLNNSFTYLLLNFCLYDTWPPSWHNWSSYDCMTSC